MRFPFRELHGLDDAQKNFEQLEGTTILDRGMVLVSGTMTITAGSGSLAIAHGLKQTPSVIPAIGPGGSQLQNFAIQCSAQSATSVTLAAQGFGASAAVNGTLAVVAALIV